MTKIAPDLDENDVQNLFGQTIEKCFLTTQYLVQIQSYPMKHNSGSLVRLPFGFKSLAALNS